MDGFGINQIAYDIYYYCELMDFVKKCCQCYCFSMCAYNVASCIDQWHSIEACGLASLFCNACCWTLCAPLCIDCKLGESGPAFDNCAKGIKYCVFSCALCIAAYVDGCYNCIKVIQMACGEGIKSHNDLLKNVEFMQKIVKKVWVLKLGVNPFTLYRPSDPDQFHIHLYNTPELLILHQFSIMRNRQFSPVVDNLPSLLHCNSAGPKSLLADSLPPQLKINKSCISTNPTMPNSQTRIGSQNNPCLNGFHVKNSAMKRLRSVSALARNKRLSRQRIQKENMSERPGSAKSEKGCEQRQQSQFFESELMTVKMMGMTVNDNRNKTYMRKLLQNRTKATHFLDQNSLKWNLPQYL